MGDDESENVAQAIKLTEENKDTDKRSIFLFSSRPSAGYILDSVDKGNKTVNEVLVNAVKKSPASILYGNGLKGLNYNIDDGFYIRRINSIELLVMQILTDDSVLDSIFKFAIKEKVISILIVGFGEYGKEFVKNALWLYQICGVNLEINIIDSQSKVELTKSLKQDCPEIIKKNPLREVGESNFCINFLDETDCYTSDLGKLFEDETKKEMLKKTQLTIVSLGDDEKNIETAVELRKLFVSISGASNKEDKEKITDTPLIYSIVYDDKKATSLTGSENGKGLVNYRGTPYRINFVGNLKSQFSYNVIENEKSIELVALEYHLDWIAKARQLRQLYENKSLTEFRNSVDQYFERKRKEYIKKNKSDKGWIKDWKDAYLFEKDVEGNPNYDMIKEELVKSLIDDYFNYEYYRSSSIAKVVHKSVIDSWERHMKANAKPTNHIGVSVCGCEYCNWRRITEHMRWNAYMRVHGYKYDENRLDRAKLHQDLVHGINWMSLKDIKTKVRIHGQRTEK